MNEPYTDKDVIKIASAYGHVLANLASVIIAEISGDKQTFDDGIIELRKALDIYKRDVPPNLQDPILQSQRDSKKTLQDLEDLVKKVSLS